MIEKYKDKISHFIPIKSLRNNFINYMDKKIVKNDIKYYNKSVKELSNNPQILHFHLETINRCNNDCNFCPVSVGNDIRKYHKISEDLFMKIINDLANMNYEYEIALYNNNEPFLDNRIIDFFKIVREKLPKAFHFIYTNALLVTLDKYIESCKYLDMFLIDNYNNDNEMNPTTKAIYDFCQNNPEYKEKTVIWMRSKNEILTTRGGNSPNKKNVTEPVKKLCPLNFYQLNVRPDGKVSMCCNDAYGEITLGDLSCSSIEEVWNSYDYKNIRTLSLKGREYIKICSNCDTINPVFPSINRLSSCKRWSIL
ncbi:radical SAM domain-containing protein [Brachyspira pilosicoli WesB]|uniref:Radical SAM domain-containing protein n=2 Tax=Brachyspira pilosicoli TaxID=52584 RepID=K0JFX2_BRAPL|nr:radical SAM/SPASM domain-containing protein [Brachyspira pilosicoli]AFR70615.1 Fe-S oxidoreductase [Brachyspira pilosicoli B2904]CCG56898.1 radical SAM domain-containing protein [Brachyspira pilosicoli WesB]